MSTNYRATFNVVTTDVEATYATALATIDRHCVVERSTWQPAGGLHILDFTYSAASDTEASAIVHDAGVAAGVPFDAVRIAALSGRRRVRAVPADLWQSAERPA